MKGRGVPVFGVDEQNALYKRLKLCKTRDNKECLAFRLTDKEEQVRMSKNDFAKYVSMNLPLENSKEPMEMSQMIVRLAQEEQNQGSFATTLKRSIECSVQELVEKMTRMVFAFQDEASQLISGCFNKKKKNFTGFLQDLNRPDFEKRLDQLVATHIIEKNENKHKAEAGPGLVEQLEEIIMRTQESINQTINEIREKLMQVSIELNGKENSQKRIEDLEIDLKSIKEVPFMKGNDHICWGTRGLSINPSQRDKVAVMNSLGNITLGDMKQGKLLQSIKLEVKSNGSFYNSLLFNQSGEMLAASIKNDSTVFLFKVEGEKLIQTQKLDRKSTGDGMNRLQWLNKNELVLGFLNPGVIEVFEVGSSTPKVTLLPELTRSTKKNGCINDFDFCPSKAEIICGGFEGSENQADVIFKMKITQMNEKHVWKHSRHSGEINTVKLSKCGSFVLSGGNDNQIILARERDGSILKKQGSWFTGGIYSIVLSPCDQFVLVQSENEVVLLKWHSKESFEKKGEASQENLGKNSINSLDVFWESSSNKNHQLLLGMEEGSVFQGNLKA